LPELWTQFEALAQKPVLVIRGANSLLLSEATLQKMAQYGATVETTTVAGQGHAPLLESGDLPHRISALLNKSDPA
jgi:pimeloyl-ACP methyl ester carboxylesterase